MSKKFNRFPEIVGTVMIIAFLSLLLGCGAQNDSTTGSTGTGTGTGTGTTPNLSLSAMTITPATLSAGGTAAVSITVNDASGHPYTTSVPVSFTSVAVQAGKATITQQVNTANGVASATYRDINCGAGDTITATLSIEGGTSLTRTGTVTVSPASAGSISFVSATPTNIALKGTGGEGRSETSVVVFKVLDINGNPIQKKVNFSLSPNTTFGGLYLSTNSADSDPVSGEVQTTVNAGTESTPVRVSAIIDGTTIATTSDVLVVSTGIPDQNSFSVSASTLNIEGWNIDGVTSDVTVRLADHFNNPVPDGTAVNFRTSGASIPASCVTANGACTVQFTSQAPRPANGRCVVLAYALGEESFTDLNANGIYDPGTTETFTDMPEPFLDANENDVKDADEDFIDTNADGLYSPGDGIFNGILRASSITGRTTIHVSNSPLAGRPAFTIVLSGSNANITINNGNSITLDHCTDGVAFNNTPVAFNISVVDVNGNVMPAGTTISVSSTNGTIISIPTSYTVPNTSTKIPPTYTVRMVSDATQGAAPALTCSNSKRSGDFNVTVTTPKGTSTYQSVGVND